MIMSWLFYFMLPNISQGYLSFYTAKEVWDATYMLKNGECHTNFMN